MNNWTIWYFGIFQPKKYQLLNQKQTLQFRFPKKTTILSLASPKRPTVFGTFKGRLRKRKSEPSVTGMMMRMKSLHPFWYWHEKKPLQMVLSKLKIVERYFHVYYLIGRSFQYQIGPEIFGWIEIRRNLLKFCE